MAKANSGSATGAKSTALAQVPVNPGGGTLATLSTLEAYAFSAIVGTGAVDAQRVALALKENMGGGSVNLFDFQRIKVPPGGITAWTVLDENGEEQHVKEVTGIVSFWTDQKAYWSKNLDDKGAQKTPPDCYSTDTVTGHGNPGGKCALCPFNQFGTAKDNTGKGKACKDVRHMMINREGDALPILLPAPPTSIKPVRQYLMMLAGRSIPYWAAITTLTLKKTSGGGNDYGVVNLRLDGVLEGEAFVQAQRYSEIIRKLIGKERLTERSDTDASEPSVQVNSTATPNNGGATRNAAPARGAAGGGAAFDDEPMNANDDIIDAVVEEPNAAS